MCISDGLTKASRIHMSEIITGSNAIDCKNRFNAKARWASEITGLAIRRLGGSILGTQLVVYRPCKLKLLSVNSTRYAAPPHNETLCTHPRHTCFYRSGLPRGEGPLPRKNCLLSASPPLSSRGLLSLSLPRGPAAFVGTPPRGYRP